MMAKVSVVGVSTAGGVIQGPGAVGWDLPDGTISLVGDAISGHGRVPHDSPVMVDGSSWFTIDGISVVVEGSLASCGHSADGKDWMDIPK